MKKIFALVLALIMTAAVFTACGGNNQTATSDEYFDFMLLEDGTYEITAKDVNNIPANVVIPSVHN